MEIDKITNLINDKLYGWSEALIKLLPRTGGSSDGIGLYIAKFIRKMSKLVDKISKNITLNNLFSTIVYFSFIGICFIYRFNHPEF
jgi:hypothetical protein